MSTEKDTEIRSKYDDYSVDELKAALNAIFDSTDEFSDSQVEEMDKIMAVLTKKNPLPHRYTAEESWKIFQETYSEELSRIGIRNTEEVMEEKPEEDTVAAADPAVVIPEASAKRTAPESVTTESGHGKGYRRLLHTALIAAAVVAAMVIITVSAAAAGINIWGWVPVWNDSTFRFMSEEAVSSTSMDIPTALKQLGVEEPLFPTWLPEGFVLEEQQIVLEENVFLYSSYVYKDRMIMISINRVDDKSGTFVVEKESGDPIEYCTMDHTHFLLNNYGRWVAIWQIGEYTVRISGDLTVEELEAIIDSVYEVK